MTWRDSIKVHPAAELFPMMSDDELRDLAADIDEHGLQQGVVFYCDREASKLSVKQRRAVNALDAGSVQLLDGRNRVEAVARFSKKYTLWPADDGDAEKAILYVSDHRLPGEAVVLHPISCADPFAYVISANAHRRHLTPEQRRELIAALLKERPERSDRTTAKIAQVSHPTVAAVRRELEKSGDVENLSTRLDSIGRKVTIGRISTHTIPLIPPGVATTTTLPATTEPREAWEVWADAIKALAPDQLAKFKSWFLSYIGHDAKIIH
jgi:hypothetical protein